MRGSRSGTSSSEIVLVTKRARSIRPSSAACARKGKSSCGIVSPPCVTAIATFGQKMSAARSASSFLPGFGMPTEPMGSRGSLSSEIPLEPIRDDEDIRVFFKADKVVAVEYRNNK